MTKVEQITEKIEEAKRLKEAQQFDVDSTRQKWNEALDKQRDTIYLIQTLKEELREAKQECYDEDGMYVGEQL